MRLYLDNCCYNRPFDDQNNRKVHLETVASDRFDYTKWQRDLWKDKTIDDLYGMAVDFEQRKAGR